tara:strand:+ start:439 stop:624 length:186 start_codon:yes stop_codon:yes gene_type:complete
MTNSQLKKMKAKEFNLRRDEVLAYQIDRKLFPPIKQPRTASEEAIRHKLMTYLAFSHGFIN